MTLETQLSHTANSGHDSTALRLSHHYYFKALPANTTRFTVACRGLVLQAFNTAPLAR